MEYSKIHSMIDEYKNDLYRLCLSLTRNKFEADDLFQLTWLKVIEKIKRLNEKNIKSLLFTTCVNTYKDIIRKKKIEDKYYEQSKEYIAVTELPIDKIVESKYVNDVLLEVIEKLNEKFKIPLKLFYINELKYSEIAKVLKIPQGTVKSRISTAKKRLRNLLEGEGYEI